MTLLLLSLIAILSWDSVPGADNYIVYEGSNFNIPKPWKMLTLTQTNAVPVSGQRPAYYYVVASNATSVSAPSAVVTYPPEAPKIVSIGFVTNYFRIGSHFENGMLLTWTMPFLPSTNRFHFLPYRTNHLFEIERTSTNVVSLFTFRSMSLPPIAVVGTNIIRYSYLDTNAFQGIATYRVRAFSWPTGDASSWSTSKSVTNTVAMLRMSTEVDTPPPLPDLPSHLYITPLAQAMRVVGTALPTLDALNGHSFSCKTISEVSAFKVERSNDLTNWEEITRNLNGLGQGVLLDCDATNACGFYRLKPL